MSKKCTKCLKNEQKLIKMDKINTKGIPFKTDAERQSTHIMVRMTEDLKKSIINKAKEERVTVSEMLRKLALNDEPALEKVKKEKKTKKKLAWNAKFGGSKVYAHTIIWHDVKGEVPADAARSYDRYHEDMNTDGCELLLLVKAKEDGETYLELQRGWYDGKIDRDHIYRDKDAEGKVIAYAFVQALEPIAVFSGWL
jgi:hypothetical protein